MITLLPPDFEPLKVTREDLSIASIAFGFTFGIGFLTTWTAIKQTAGIHGRYGASKLNSPYVWMIWLEILVCLIFAVICWLHLYGVIPPSFAFFFVILTTWALQVQFLLQIIINRVSILLTDRPKAMRLKISVAILITAVNISVYNIWIPARLQISARYIYINVWWDRCEKVIYLLVDATLNWYFIHTVREQLVKQGLKKYDKLVKFNMWIISFSLSMDVLIISMMSLNNSFVYMQFHPLAYIVKLNIEMSMAELIAKVAHSHSSSAIDTTDFLTTTNTLNSAHHHRSLSEKLSFPSSHASRRSHPYRPQPAFTRPRQSFTTFKASDWADNPSYSYDIELSGAPADNNNNNTKRKSSVFDDAFGFGASAGTGTAISSGVTVMREVCISVQEVEKGGSSFEDTDLEMDTTREGSYYEEGKEGEGSAGSSDEVGILSAGEGQRALAGDGGKEGMDLTFCTGGENL